MLYAGNTKFWLNFFIRCLRTSQEKSNQFVLIQRQKNESNWFVQMWSDMGWEASWLCYDQVATSQIGNEEKKCRFFIFYFHLCLSNCTLSFSKASRQWDAEFKSRLWGCSQGPRSGRHQYYLSMRPTDLVDINICFSMRLSSKITISSIPSLEAFA